MYSNSFKNYFLGILNTKKVLGSIRPYNLRTLRFVNYSLIEGGRNGLGNEEQNLKVN